jgi:WD40 repeat protein/uncharacterized caspase-like protein
VQLGNGAYLNDIAFSPDGRYVVTAGGNAAILWEVATGIEIRQFQHPSEVNAVAFSPNGQFILTGCGRFDSNYNFALLWDIASGQLVKQYRHKYSVECLTFSADGHYFMTGSSHEVILWHVATGHMIRSFVHSEAAASRISHIALSADAHYLLTGCLDGIARLWDVNTGKEVRTFKQPEATSVSIPYLETTVAFSPDNRYILTGGGWQEYGMTYIARLWDTTTGAEIRQFKCEQPVRFVAFSPDGRFILTVSGRQESVYIVDTSVQLWDQTTGKLVWQFRDSSIYKKAVFSSDGRMIATSGNPNTDAIVWDAVTGEKVQKFYGRSSPVSAVALSNNGNYLLTGIHSKANESGFTADFAAALWDLTTGIESQRFKHPIPFANTVEFSSDNKIALTTGNEQAHLWNLTTGEEIRTIKTSAPIQSAALSPDSKYVLLGCQDSTVTLWETETGREVRRFPHPDESIFSVAFSPNGRFIATGGSVEIQGEREGVAQVWDVTTAEEVKRFQVTNTGGDTVFNVLFSPNNNFLLTVSLNVRPFDHFCHLWNIESGKQIVEFGAGYNQVFFARFSADGRYLVTGGADGDAHLWDPYAGKEFGRFAGHRGVVRSATFSHDGRFVITGGDDATTRVWNASTGQELCLLTSFPDGTWIVVDPQGRFDTNNLDDIQGMRWVLDDDPMHPLSPEIFMKEYYEPRLLSRILQGKPLREVKSIADLNRVQPQVKILRVEPAPDSPNIATVTVEVAKGKGVFTRGGKKVELETGVYDLRLFRNRQLVGYAPAKGGAVKLDPVTGKAIFTFPNIRLPQGRDVREVILSAYAFNSDGIKSSTSRQIVKLSKPVAPVKGRAYIISVGVNAYESPVLDLSYAANDARRIQKSLSENLSGTGQYEEVIAVPLISDSSGSKLLEKTATKANLKAVLDLLSGKSVDPTIIKAIPNADKLRRATPDDLVILSYSSHGHLDNNGSFYFFPYDVGKNAGQQPTAALLKQCISSEQLSLWLRDVDAGEIVMIVDACHSAAAIDAGNFVEGPMDSRGLGQLAYDKGMRILTSTQAEEVALEEPRLRQGLLIYALIREGIEAKQADYKPKDGRITLSEWLSYGAERVPKLFDEVKGGQSIGAKGSRVRMVKIGAKTPPEKLNSQKPSLFDFNRKKLDILLVKE